LLQAILFIASLYSHYTIFSLCCQGGKHAVLDVIFNGGEPATHTLYLQFTHRVQDGQSLDVQGTYAGALIGQSDMFKCRDSASRKADEFADFGQRHVQGKPFRAEYVGVCHVVSFLKR